MHCHLTRLLRQLSSLSWALAVVAAVWNPCSYSEHLRPGLAQPLHCMRVIAASGHVAQHCWPCRCLLCEHPAFPSRCQSRSGTSISSSAPQRWARCATSSNSASPCCWSQVGPVLPSTLSHVHLVSTCIAAHAAGYTGHSHVGAEFRWEVTKPGITIAAEWQSRLQLPTCASSQA